MRYVKSYFESSLLKNNEKNIIKILYNEHIIKSL